VSYGTVRDYVEGPRLMAEALGRECSGPAAVHQAAVPEDLVGIRIRGDTPAGDDHLGEVRPRARAAAVPDIRQRHRDLVGVGQPTGDIVDLGGTAGDGRGVVPASPVHADDGPAAVGEDGEDRGPDLGVIPDSWWSRIQVVQGR